MATADAPPGADSALAGRMVFIVGAQRSGTYLLHRIVSSHPQIASVPSETMLFSHGIRALLDGFHHGARGTLRVATMFAERDELQRTLRRLCDDVLRGYLPPDARLLVERSPPNVHHLDIIGAIYPDAHVLHIVRDGRDVARSMVSQLWGPVSLEAAAREWRTAVTRARAQRPPRYLEVRYEELLMGPDESITRIFSELGVAVDERVLRRALSELDAEINVDALDSRPTVGKWNAAWSRRDRATFEAIAGDVRRELDYEQTSDWVNAPAEKRSGAGRREGPLRRRRQRADARAAQQFEELLRLANLRTDALLEALHTRDRAALVALSEQGCAFEVVGRPGDDPIALLLDDPAFAGRQLAGDVHPGIPLTVADMRYEIIGGEARRLLLVTSSETGVSRVTVVRAE
jgi:hypothetical protein